MACVCSNRALPCLVPDIPRRTVPYDEMLTIDTSLEYEIEPSKFPGSGGRGAFGSTDASERILQIGTRSAPTPDCTITHVSPGPLPPNTQPSSQPLAVSSSLNEPDEALTQLIGRLSGRKLRNEMNMAGLKPSHIQFISRLLSEMHIYHPASWMGGVSATLLLKGPVLRGLQNIGGMACRVSS